MTKTDIIKNYHKRLWEDQDLTAIDDLFTKDAIISSPLNTTTDPITMKEVVEKWLVAFPDLEVDWQEYVEQENTVVSRWRATGTHMGSFFDTSPSHQEISYSGVTFYTFNNENKIVKYWALVDMHAIMAQLMKYESISQIIE